MAQIIATMDAIAVPAASFVALVEEARGRLAETSNTARLDLADIVAELESAYGNLLDAVTSASDGLVDEDAMSKRIGRVAFDREVKGKLRAAGLRGRRIGMIYERHLKDELGDRRFDKVASDLSDADGPFVRSLKTLEMELSYVAEDQTGARQQLAGARALASDAWLALHRLRNELGEQTLFPSRADVEPRRPKKLETFFRRHAWGLR